MIEVYNAFAVSGMVETDGGIGFVPKAVLILFVISGEFIKEDF